MGQSGACRLRAPEPWKDSQETGSHRGPKRTSGRSDTALGNKGHCAGGPGPWPYLFSSLARQPRRTGQARAPRTARVSLAVVALEWTERVGVSRQLLHSGWGSGQGSQGRRGPLTRASSALGRSRSAKHWEEQGTEGLCQVRPLGALPTPRPP